jgi:hypothetical protein
MNLYDATIPVFSKLLKNVHVWLDKAAAHATARKFELDTLLTARLAPDQYPFARQIHGGCESAKMGAAALTGQTPSDFGEADRTIGELRQRIDSVLAYLANFKREDFSGAEERICSHPTFGGKTLTGFDLLNHVILPNFHFHMTTGYAILRHNGVDLGKLDYLVSLPFRS